ncbi:MAG: hypothetical protein ABJA78_01525 [Ferruginibacter sp.]
MKSGVIIILTVIFCNAIDAQRVKDLYNITQQSEFRENNIYIVCRGTKSKSSLIAHRFNIADTNITHAGIGFYKNGKILLYNVTDIYDHSKSALVVDSLESFVVSSDVYYLSIWECNSSPLQIKKLENICHSYGTRKIFFDASFRINDDDSLYCSEFCALVLEKLDPVKFNFKPLVIDLNNRLYEKILERKKLSYYPVDFFQQNSSFRKIFSYRFSG